MLIGRYLQYKKNINLLYWFKKDPLVHYALKWKNPHCENENHSYANVWQSWNWKNKGITYICIVVVFCSIALICALTMWGKVKQDISVKKQLEKIKLSGFNIPVWDFKWYRIGIRARFEFQTWGLILKSIHIALTSSRIMMLEHLIPDITHF